MARLFALSLFAALTLGTATGEAKKKRVVVDRIVAVVDDSAITKSALDRELRWFRKEIDKKHALDGDARAAALRDAERAQLYEMIDTRLLLKAAERMRVTASKEDIDQAIAQIAKQNGQTVAELWQLVAREGHDEVDYRRRIGEQIASWRVATQEAHKRNAGLSKLAAEEQQRRVAATMKTLVSELRSAAHIEERL
jgi:peptidyl-prolyl cis-trans isomerase SurA